MLVPKGFEGCGGEGGEGQGSPSEVRSAENEQTKRSCPHSAAEAGIRQEVNPLHCQDSALNAPVRRAGHERPS